MNAASYYSKQNFTERVMAFFLMVMCGGYYWWQLFWGLPNVIRQCVDFWLLFPAEVALYYTAVLGGTCLIFVMMVVVLPLVVLNGVYWTSWSLRCDLKENEIRVLRSSLFRTKRAAADLSRISVGKKRPLSLLRLFWPPYWSSFSWGRAALEFDLDGRRFRWPCATEEEADWLLDALEKRRISVTRG